MMVALTKVVATEEVRSDQFLDMALRYRWIGWTEWIYYRCEKEEFDF